MLEPIWSYILQNWGNLISALGLIISFTTLAKVSSISAAQKKEREVIKKVLDLEELQIRIEETKIVLQEISAQLSISSSSNNLISLLNERINVLFQTSGELSSSIESINILKGDSPEKVSSGYFSKARFLLEAGKFNEAINYYQRCTLFFETLEKDKYRNAIMHGNYGISICYMKLENYGQAKYYANKTSEMASQSNDNAMIESCKLLIEEIQGLELDTFMKVQIRRKK
jgi:tetratricopeptide (TPR) repeat protein